MQDKFLYLDMSYIIALIAVFMRAQRLIFMIFLCCAVYITRSLPSAAAVL